MSLLDQDTGDPDYGTKRTDQVVDSSPSIASVAAPVANPPPALPTPGQAMQLPAPGSDEAKAITKPFEDYTKQAEKQRQAGLNVLSHDAQLAEEARQRTEYTEGEIIPWDIDAQQRRFATDPIGSFGSLGSLFGIMAAAFTKQPMTNALNASAAAMTALREGKDEEFKRAYTAWKDNNEMAYKRHSLLQQDYNNTITKGEKDMGLIKFGLEQNMQKYKDEVGLAYLKTYGYGPEFVSFMTARNDAIEKANKISADATLDTYRNEMVKDGFKRNEEIQDPHQRAAANMAVMSRFFNFGDIEKHPNAALAGQMILLHGPGGPDPWPQEKLNKEVRDLIHPGWANQQPTVSKGEEDWRRQRAAELVEQSKDPETGEPKMRLTEAYEQARSEQERGKAADRAFSHAPGKSQQDAQIAEWLASGDPEKVEKAKKLTEARKQLSEELSTKDKLTPLALRQKGMQFILGDTSQRQGLARSGQIISFDNAVAELQQEMGITPEQMKTNIADFGGLKTAYRTIYQRSAAISVSASEAEVGLQIAREYNNSVDRGKISTINKLLLATRAEIGDEKVWGFKQALHTLINQYANTISRTGSGTVNDKKRAEDSLSTYNGIPVASREALEAVFVVMEREIQAAKNAPVEARKLFQKGIEATTIEKIIFPFDHTGGDTGGYH